MADVSAALKDWSATTASNSPAGGTTIGTGLDDNLREIQGAIVRGLSNKGADIASATTTDLGAVEGLMHDITGTTTITGFGTVRAGIWKIIKFEGALTLTHNATSLILPGAANITTADGDTAIVISEGSGNWRCVAYVKATGKAIISPAVGDVTGLGTGVATALAVNVGSAGAPVVNGGALGTPSSGTLTNCTGLPAAGLVPSTVTNTLGADVALNNTATYFTGPSCAQGTSGTWLAVGVVTVTDTSGAGVFEVRLTDGTTVLASTRLSTTTAGHSISATLVGVIASPAGNIKIEVRDTTSTSGAIKYNYSTNSKDSTLTVIRIG